MVTYSDLMPHTTRIFPSGALMNRQGSVLESVQVMNSLCMSPLVSLYLKGAYIKDIGLETVNVCCSRKDCQIHSTWISSWGRKSYLHSRAIVLIPGAWSVISDVSFEENMMSLCQSVFDIQQASAWSSGVRAPCV